MPQDRFTNSLSDIELKAYNKDESICPVRTVVENIKEIEKITKLKFIKGIHEGGNQHQHLGNFIIYLS